MNCKQCGSENVESAKFCTSCGYKLVQDLTCIKCGTDLKPGTIFCVECGAKVAPLTSKNFPHSEELSSSARTKPLPPPPLAENVHSTVANPLLRATDSEASKPKSSKNNLLIAALAVLVAFGLGGLVTIIQSSKNKTQQVTQSGVQGNVANQAEGPYKGWKDFTFGGERFVIKYPAIKADQNESAEPICKPLGSNGTQCFFVSELTSFTFFEIDTGAAQETLAQQADKTQKHDEQNGYKLISRRDLQVNGLSLTELIETRTDYQPHTWLYVGDGRLVSIVASNRGRGDFSSSSEEIEKFLESFALVKNSATQSSEPIAQVKVQSNKDIHTMSDQELESELSVSWQKNEKAIEVFTGCSGEEACKNAKYNMHQAELRPKEIAHEIRARRLSNMSTHDKNIISAEGSYNAQAATWKNVEENDTSNIYVDTSSISAMDKSIRRIHVLLNYKNRTLNVMSAVFIKEFDCNNNSVWVDSSTSYSETFAQGYQIGSFFPEDGGVVPAKFVPIVKDEGLHKQYDFACAKESVVLTTPSPQPTASVSHAIESMLNAATTNNFDNVKSSMDSLGIQQKPARGNKKIARAKNKDGITALNTSDFKGAVVLFTEGISADQGDIELVNNLGYALMMDGQPDSAKSKLIDVLNMDIARSGAWANLGEVFAKSGNQDNAVAAFKLSYYFSRAPEKTIVFFKKLSDTDPDENVRNASNKAVSSFTNIQTMFNH